MDWIVLRAILGRLPDQLTTIARHNKSFHTVCRREKSSLDPSHSFGMTVRDLNCATSICDPARNSLVGGMDELGQTGVRASHAAFAADHFSPNAYLTTLSACRSTCGGIVTPICLAVLRLITSSNFFGCSTGRSAGLAPFSILST